jgi:hypothetical protein
MADLFLYCTAENYGKNFFTVQDRHNFYLRGYSSDVWVVGNNEKAALWIADRNGVTKTKAEAQALIDADVAASQVTWDALSDEEKVRTPDRPGPITLP